MGSKQRKNFYTCLVTLEKPEEFSQEFLVKPEEFSQEFSQEFLKKPEEF